MTLLDRLEGTEEPKIAVHQFMAALGEYKRGAITGPQVVTAFNLSPIEATALDDWLSNLDTNKINRAKIHDVLLLLEDGLYAQAKAILELEI